MSMFNKNMTSMSLDKSLPGKLMLKNVHIVDVAEKLNVMKSLIIQKGKITDILDKPPQNFEGEILEHDEGLVMPGWFDMHVHFREPGREDEETLITGSNAAANGGFTGAACMPNTEPAIDSQEIINFICEQTQNGLVDVHPVAAITKGRKGEQLAPIAEMVDAGAVAISDDGTPLMNAELMRRALEYSKMFGIPILGHEEDANLSKNRHMHEGFYSTKLGIEGIPPVSEEILIARDIMLAEYTGGKFHVCHISTKGGVDLVRQAKMKGINVTCEVTPHHFTLTDQVVESYDTNTKMSPPLRSAEDRQALMDGLKDGTIDVIATDHAPHSIEEKEAEYIYAPFGITGLETAAGLIISQLYDKKILSLADIYEKCVRNPRQILNLEVPKIKVGNIANLTLLTLNQKWKFRDTVSLSKSNNSPFLDFPLKGRSLAAINNGKIFMTSSLS